MFTRWANSLFADPITDVREIMELDFLQAFAKLITGQEIVSAALWRFRPPALLCSTFRP